MYFKIQMEKCETTTSKTQSSDKKLKSEQKYVTNVLFLVCLMLGNRPGAFKAKAAARKNYRV